MFYDMVIFLSNSSLILLSRVHDLIGLVETRDGLIDSTFIGLNMPLADLAILHLLVLDSILFFFDLPEKLVCASVIFRSTIGPQMSPLKSLSVFTKTKRALS